eukprot:9502649-Lingulodinium_polyedra.AAC.1
MEWPWRIPVLPMGCPWTVHGLAMENPWAVDILSTDSPGIGHGQRVDCVGCPCVGHRQHVECPWGVHGQEYTIVLTL